MADTSLASLHPSPVRESLQRLEQENQALKENQEPARVVRLRKNSEENHGCLNRKEAEEEEEEEEEGEDDLEEEEDEEEEDEEEETPPALMGKRGPPCVGLREECTRPGSLDLQLPPRPHTHHAAMVTPLTNNTILPSLMCMELSCCSRQLVTFAFTLKGGGGGV